MIKASLCTILAVQLVFSLAFSQDKVTKALTTTNEWSPGSVLTIDGKELKGSVKYDDKLGILNFDDGDESKSFSPRSVTAFEFFDGQTQKQRVFYSLEFEGDKSIRTPLFFEVLKDFQSFAVLAKADPIKIEERTNPSPSHDPVTGNMIAPPDYSSISTEIIHVETIYFLDEHGKIEPYIQVIRKVIDRPFFDPFFDGQKKKNKFIDKHIIEKYFTKEELIQMTEYAEKNDLEFRAKDDFIKLLDFCAELKAKK